MVLRRSMVDDLQWWRHSVVEGFGGGGFWCIGVTIMDELVGGGGRWCSGGVGRGVEFIGLMKPAM